MDRLGFGNRSQAISRAAACLMLFSACGDGRDPELEAAVARELELFSSDAMPDALIAAAQERAILVLGEEHYVQEHHEYLASPHSAADDLRSSLSRTRLAKASRFRARCHQHDL